MDILSAVQWVEDNRRIILSFARRYEPYCPYGYEDFLSMANEAAIIASMQQPADQKMFQRIFWRSLKRILKEIVPNPLHENWSNSVPSNMCVELPPDIVVEEEMAVGNYTEDIYLQAKDFFKPKQRTLLCLLLGLDEISGRCTEYEAAKILGMSHQYVNSFFPDSCKKIKELVREKKINLDLVIEKYQNAVP